MPSIVLLNQLGQKVGDLQLSANVFAVEDHQQAVFDTIVAERAAMRQGTQKAKTRSEVSGGGRKPWRQKGTGRARQGSTRSPQWRGGGVVFAPTPRSYVMKVNKKVVRLAMKCALTYKVQENKLIALNELTLQNFKTKGLVEVLNNVKAEGKILVITKEANDLLELAGRNIPNVLVETASHVSVYQMMNASCVVMTQDAVAYYEEVLK
jgi:large subunit ribosomal protein L4